MTITNGYATLDEFKQYEEIESYNAVDDSVIENIIEGVSREIDRLSGRRFYADTIDATRYYTAIEPLCITIDDLSAAPTSVSVDYTEGLRSYTVLTSTDYDMTPDNALFHGEPYRKIEINPAYSSYFPLSRRGVKVIGKFGFPSVPDQIKQACLIASVAAYKQRFGENMQTTAQVTAAGVVLTPKFGFPDAAMKMIREFRMHT